ncbi:hypothetical protein RhiJN_19456 [Ceratobasidium sp. AG-Ba]|nr:hypothetical protein RhiJN_19456 [Ceratobasidium sp. AG-Ba]
MSPYYTGPVPTAPRFWDMKATSASLDNNLDRAFQMPGPFDQRTLKQDSPEVVSSPESEYYTPTLNQDGFVSNPPSTAFCTPESIKTSPDHRVAMYRHASSPDSPSISPSPSPTESMFSRPSRPDSATSFVESDEGHGPKRSPLRQRSSVPSLVVTDYDSDEERKPEVDASPIQDSFAVMQARAHQRSMELRAEAMAFRPTARDARQITSVPLPSPSVHGNFPTPVVRPQARVAPAPQTRPAPQYIVPPRSHPIGQGINSMPQPTASMTATVAPRYKQAPAFQVVPRRFPTPKPILAMRMANGPQQAMQPMANTPQARAFKSQQQQQATLYDSRGQTFENKAVTIRPPVSRVPAMPLSSARHLWPSSGAPLPNGETNSAVWHPSLQEARSIVSIQQARILKGFANGIPHGGGLYLPIPFDETFA